MVGDRFVIRGHHPVRNTITVAAGLAIAMVAVALAYWIGGTGSASELRLLKDQIERQRQQIKALRIGNRDLRAHLVSAERIAQVDAEANADARLRLARSAEELEELKRAVGLYRMVLSEDNKRNKLHIHGIRVLASRDRVYKFEVTLTRFLDADRVVRGTVGLLISRAGRVEESDNIRLELPFKLKHFQVVRGEFELPDDFLPSEILVQAAT